MKKLHCASVPCSTCPYRKDVPSGVWDASEYAKLRDYDNNEAFATFHCHQEAEIGKPTVCRGWLSVHFESVAARLAVLNEKVTVEELYAEPLVPLYASGNEAADAGMKDIKRPKAKARKAIDRLSKKRGYAK